MIRSDFIGWVVLNDVVNVGDYSGRVTSPGILGLIVRQKLPDASDAEVLDSIKRLYEKGSVALEKYDGNTQAYKPYARYPDDAVFFYAGQFRIRINPGRATGVRPAAGANTTRECSEAPQDWVLI
jgi:hypothetical protein